jgi:hypothetical protein
MNISINPKAFGSPQQAPVALNISDMQLVAFRWPTEKLKVTGFEYALGWLKKFPNGGGLWRNVNC